MQRQRLVGVGQCVDRAIQQVALDVEQRHAPAFRQKAFGHRKPDAARGTRHQRDFLEVLSVIASVPLIFGRVL